ncbi:MAG: hypothetical protein IT305_32305 [Chloroflexi bacterium]|nr:hypothetical protein [Chloroflexota bacterium]
MGALVASPSSQLTQPGSRLDDADSRARTLSTAKTPVTPVITPIVDARTVAQVVQTQEQNWACEWWPPA